MLGLTINELIGYLGTVAGFGWGVLQYKAKIKLEKQKVKYLTYSKVSENLNKFNKNLDSLKWPQFLEGFKEVADNLKLVNEGNDRISLSINKIKEELQNTSVMLTLN